MVTKVWNDGIVFYQQSADDDSIGNAAVIVHRDNGGTLLISQEGRDIVIDLHRANIREFKAVLDQALASAEKANRQLRG